MYFFEDFGGDEKILGKCVGREWRLVDSLLFS